MNIDSNIQSVKSFVGKYRNLLIAGLLILLLIAAGIGMFTGWIEDKIGWHFIHKTESNINAEQKNVNAINANLVNINGQIIEQTENVNRLGTNYNAAKDETNKAREDVNRALENLNRIQKGNFNGTTMDQANKARCEIFPDRPECH